MESSVDASPDASLIASAAPASGAFRVAGVSKEPLRVIISLDVEEEGLFSGRYPTHGCTVRNVGLLPRLAPLSRELGFPLTLLCAYAVFVDPAARDVLAHMRGDLGAEIGAHLHHWSTPPPDDPADDALNGGTPLLSAHGPRRSDRLPRELFRARLRALLRAGRDVAGGPLASFRMGRWDLKSVLRPLLAEEGILVDSSVCPLRVFPDGPDHFLAPADPYWVECPGPRPDASDVPCRAAFSDGAGAPTNESGRGACDAPRPGGPAGPAEPNRATLPGDPGARPESSDMSRRAAFSHSPDAPPAASAGPAGLPGRNAQGRRLLEVPITQIPLHPALARLWYGAGDRLPADLRQKFLDGFHLWGVLSANPVWHAPAVMRWAVRRHTARGGRVLSLFWHSSEMLPGASPNIPDQAAADALIARVRDFLIWLRAHYDVRGVTLSSLYADPPAAGFPARPDGPGDW